jgi:hypothetical protein
MMGRAIALHFSLPETEEVLFLHNNKRLHPQVPRITVVHDDRPMLKVPDELEQSKARYRDKKVIFLVRDPRDVIVSSYFEMSKRGQIFGDNPYEKRKGVFEGSLPDFINRKEGGFETILTYYNIWANNRHIPKDFLLIRYEDMRANPANELRRVLNFLGLADISDATIVDAVEFASFDNMRKMEAEGQFQTSILNPANKSDQDSYKTRKGKVKGFADHLSDSEIQFVNRKMQDELSGFFGYNC